MAYEAAECCLNFFNSISNYWHLNGSSKNLYKCFLNNSFWQGNKVSVLAFITDTGIFDEKKGIKLREESIKRLCYHFKFRNELKLFPMVGNQKKFELNILTNFYPPNSSTYCANLFHPKTIDDCNSQRDSKIPPVRNENGWVLKGHKDRLIEINNDCLSIFADFLENNIDSVRHTRFPKIHSKNELNVIKKLTEKSIRVGTNKAFFSTVMYDENASQKKGIIKRHTDFNLKPIIISGPHIHCSNPFYQTPKRICNTHRAYDIINIEDISDNYLPRTNYILLKDEANVLGVDYFRMAFRRRLNAEQERTFLPALIPPGVRHIHPVVSCGLLDYNSTLNMLAFSVSIIADYWVKISSKEDFYGADVGQFPLLNFFSNRYFWVIQHVLALNCITVEYSLIWNKIVNEFPEKKFKWLSNDQRLKKMDTCWNDWNPSTPLRDSFSRRTAGIEIDVGVAINLGMTFSDLISIFNSKFELLKLVEADTWYDQNGRIVFTCSKGLSRVGFCRKASKADPIGWEEIKDMKSGTVERTITDDTLPGGPRERTIVYQAPFDRCDREKDYEIAWAEFERRFASTKYTNNTK